VHIFCTKVLLEAFLLLRFGFGKKISAMLMKLTTEYSWVLKGVRKGPNENCITNSKQLLPDNFDAFITRVIGQITPI